MSQSLLNLEDTRHPLFAYYRQQRGQVWARSHAYQLTMKRKLERIERAGEATEGASLTTEAKTSLRVMRRSPPMFRARCKANQELSDRRRVHTPMKTA